MGQPFLKTQYFLVTWAIFSFEKLKLGWVTMLKRFLQDESGATAIEYGLIVALIALAIIVAISGVGNSTGNMWNFVSDEVIKSSTFD